MQEYKIVFVRESGYDVTFLDANSVADALSYLRKVFDDVVMVTTIKRRAYHADIDADRFSYDLGIYATPEQAHSAIDKFTKWDGTLIPGENCTTCVTEYWHEIIMD